MRETPTIVKVGSLKSIMSAAGKKYDNLFPLFIKKPQYLAHAGGPALAGAGIAGAGMAGKEMLDDEEGVNAGNIAKAIGLGGIAGAGVGTSRYARALAAFKKNKGIHKGLVSGAAGLFGLGSIGSAIQVARAKRMMKQMAQAGDAESVINSILK